MAPQWISAKTALAIFAEISGDALAKKAICRGAHLGLIQTRARTFSIDGKISKDVDLPTNFWWAEGDETLEQAWDFGEFGTWIDRKVRLQAQGVEFNFNDLRESLDPARAAIIARQLSVAGNADWMTANAAHKFMYLDLDFLPTRAGDLLIEQCQLGFAAARAVVWRQTAPGKADDWAIEERERDIPLWFWKEFCGAGRSTQDWVSGTFAGRGRGPQGDCWITLNAVHFLRASLEEMLPRKPGETNKARDLLNMEESKAARREKLPSLSEAELVRWWETKASVRDGLSEPEITTLLKAAYPQNSVSRERIRQLMGSRKRGPKPISPKNTAK